MAELAIGENGIIRGVRVVCLAGGGTCDDCEICVFNEDCDREYIGEDCVDSKRSDGENVYFEAADEGVE